VAASHYLRTPLRTCPSLFSTSITLFQWPPLHRCWPPHHRRCSRSLAPHLHLRKGLYITSCVVCLYSPFICAIRTSGAMLTLQRRGVAAVGRGYRNPSACSSLFIRIGHIKHHINGCICACILAIFDHHRSTLIIARCWPHHHRRHFWRWPWRWGGKSMPGRLHEELQEHPVLLAQLAALTHDRLRCRRSNAHVLSRCIGMAGHRNHPGASHACEFCRLVDCWPAHATTHSEPVARGAPTTAADHPAGVQA